MKTTDARRLTHTQLTELRTRGVTAVQNGESPEDVVRILGISRATIYGWLVRYRQGGWGRLDAKKRGGRPSKLDGRALAWIYKVVQKDPRQYKFKFALWTSVMVREIILRQFGVSLSRSSVCRLMGQMGLSAQRPLRRAYQQDPQKVDHWLKTEFPAIRRQALKKKADIWFADEAGVRSNAHAETTWAPRGQTPIVSTTGARFRVNLISAVSRRGDFRFMAVDERVTGKVFIEFLKRLLVHAPRVVFLIVDGHPTHKAVMVRKFVETVSDKLRLFFLPPYSPELNPDESVWNDLKNNGIGRMPIGTKDAMKRDILSHLRSLQKSPLRIQSFFLAPTTAYAA
jgi:transposase